MGFYGLNQTTLRNKLMSLQIELVKSPCIGTCCLDERDVCLGCFRSLEEIKSWSAADNAARHSILADAIRRQQEK